MIVASPILIPLLGAALSMLAFRRAGVQRVISLAGGLSLLGSAVALFVEVRREGVISLQLGNWAAPYGITLVSDLFSAVMVLLAAVIGLAVVVYSLAAAETDEKHPAYYPLVHVLLTGVCGAFLTGDIFNLYVWFEVMLIASFVLLALGGGREQMEGAVKYVTLNLISSALFLTAAGLVYGKLGTLNLADLAVKIGEVEDPGLVTTVGLLFLIAFGVKAALFPLFFWLPASYHVPATAISALFAGLLTKVGVYAIGRVFTLVFLPETGFAHGLLLAGAAVTMVTGVLGAAAQNEFRRILAFHSVSQIGYIAAGLALFSPLAVAGAIYFMVHHSLVKANLFFVSGLAHRWRGTGELARLGGFYREYPKVSALFLVSALSLAGIPPFSGFFAKLAVVRAGLDANEYLLVGVALAVGLLTLYSMTKIWNQVFWPPAPAGAPAAVSADRDAKVMIGVVTAFAAATLALGLAANFAFGVALEASAQLLNPAGYIEAVLGGKS